MTTQETWPESISAALTGLKQGRSVLVEAGVVLGFGLQDGVVGVGVLPARDRVVEELMQRVGFECVDLHLYEMAVRGEECPGAGVGGLARLWRQVELGDLLGGERDALGVGPAVRARKSRSMSSPLGSWSPA